MISIYVTCPDKTSATRISRALLDAGLIACANIHPVFSVYKWEGQVVEEEEFVCIMKSVEDRWTAIQSKVLEIHPYELPAIIKYKASANDAYQDWVTTEVK